MIETRAIPKVDMLACTEKRVNNNPSAVLLLSGLWTAVRSNDDRGRMVAIGVMTLVFVHIYINIAMSIGLMPITGLPLPFISAGKTFLVTLLAALGIVQSISLHREEKI